MSVLTRIKETTTKLFNSSSNQWKTQSNCPLPSSDESGTNEEAVAPT